MHPMLNIAIKAARKAGNLANRAILDIDRIKVVEKAPHDYVTEIDHAAQDAIVDILLNAYPHHTIIAEESENTEQSLEALADHPFVWIVDPIDGTRNFMRGLPSFAVSIALMEKGQITQSVIYDPSLNELFTATRGNGAMLNDRRIRTSKRIRIQEGLFPYCASGLNKTQQKTLFEVLQSFDEQADGFHSTGSAALNLAYVAAGRYDGFFALGLKPWDFAAGALLILEAGGLITDFSGDESWLRTGNLVAAGNKMLPPLLKMIAPLQTV